MKVGIYYNTKQVTADAVGGIADQVKRDGSDAVIFSATEEISDVDRLLVLGGDGTILHSAKRASELNIPMLGVNYGTRGFLTEFERDETDRAVDFVLHGNAELLKRSMIEVAFNGSTIYCLNELTLARASFGQEDKAVTISLEIDDRPAGEFIADGLIVATPTGSTAYSLSAGGSIMAPDCETFLLTPLCSSSLRSRPIVCSDSSVLRLSVAAEGASLILHGDGLYLGTAKKGDQLTVRKSERYATFLTKDKSEFFRRLTKKIN